MILQGLKPRIFNELNKCGRQWLTELSSVIWSLRKTSSRATGFTQFFLVYGVEAILPTDLEDGSLRLRAYSESNNQVNCEDSLDHLEEAWDVAFLHSARYHHDSDLTQFTKITAKRCTPSTHLELCMNHGTDQRWRRDVVYLTLDWV
jgi:hypothetical protein